MNSRTLRFPIAPRHGAALLAGLVAAGAVHAASIDAPAARIGHLNDTGITACEAPNGTMVDDCTGSPQDAGSGRDVTHPGDADGRLGFQFVKLAADGTRLPAEAVQWACVADRVTGLVWEMKTTDGGLHDASRRYTNLGDRSAADTSTFVDAVNGQALCGRTDWRLPMRNELLGIVDYSKSYPGPTVDTGWFPNSDGYSFWTSTVHATNPQGATWYVNFQDGYTATLVNTYAFGEARAVSGAAPRAAPRFKAVGADASQVADAQTGLVWARCSVGQS